MESFTAEQCAFLLQDTRTGKLATVRKDGRPHVVPIWFVLDGNVLVFNTDEHTVKAANMRRDPRVTMCVDEEIAPFAYIQIEGTALVLPFLQVNRLPVAAVVIGIGNLPRIAGFFACLPAPECIQQHFALESILMRAA